MAEFTYSGDETVVFPDLRTPSGSTAVGVPGEPVFVEDDTTGDVDRPGLTPVDDAAKALVAKVQPKPAAVPSDPEPHNQTPPTVPPAPPTPPPAPAPAPPGPNLPTPPAPPAV